MSESPRVVYFSTKSGNTRRFVEKLGMPAERIPFEHDAPPLKVQSPYILIVPSYGGGNASGAVPRPVIHFLNDEHNRRFIRGVIAAGNTNFGTAYGIAGRIVAEKCDVPLLYRFELFGTPQDVANVRQGVTSFWQQHQ
ncbi:MAG: class Ib ribonucleoside-diphosphate reductase assembly flavoprotein NrdI [Halomonas sp.]|nr:class Ib ribonucleoside-diphosphate reductase assembly flavoprotein NrdI [Halomonas sp.]MDN6296750.1 class Ib ribonucleoside-diphosphate reductase assembly flavoprotein NrdI [Halomonas sp.]MDN6314024.1 class Ib ribonucleoside-diphosphate reductase assembly flavoprotein NrdI [Halomonas sp.]MDN6335432.1 class Ib ribonucleoside-diphosphate reductase assembly flavoprotein NrdI [Halomonas sp.]